MAFRKGFTKHMWPTQERMKKRKKLEIFLESVHVLDDFRGILSFVEYQVIYLKLTCQRRSIAEVVDYLCDYRLYNELAHMLIAEYADINEKTILKIYRSGINKILSLVTFRKGDYSLEIDYEGRGQNRDRKPFPVYRNTETNSYICFEPERQPIKHTEEQIMKIKANRMLEAQSNGGLHDKEKRPVMAAQESAIEQMLEVEHE